MNENKIDEFDPSCLRRASVWFARGPFVVHETPDTLQYKSRIIYFARALRDSPPSKLHDFRFLHLMIGLFEILTRNATAPHGADRHRARKPGGSLEEGKSPVQNLSQFW